LNEREKSRIHKKKDTQKKGGTLWIEEIYIIAESFVEMNPSTEREKGGGLLVL